ncbi:unnamed protein product, partial [Fusarium langsethiae]
MTPIEQFSSTIDWRFDRYDIDRLGFLINRSIKSISRSISNLGNGGVEAQYGIIWQVAVAYEFLLSTLEKAKTEATHRVEPSYYSSCVNSAWAKLNKYYTKLDETPIYYAATVLHPGIQWSFLTKAYGEKEEWLFAARQL